MVPGRLVEEVASLWSRVSTWSRWLPGTQGRAHCAVHLSGPTCLRAEDSVRRDRGDEDEVKFFRMGPKRDFWSPGQGGEGPGRAAPRRPRAAFRRDHGAARPARAWVWAEKDLETRAGCGMRDAPPLPPAPGYKPDSGAQVGALSVFGHQGSPLQRVRVPQTLVRVSVPTRVILEAGLPA